MTSHRISAKKPVILLPAPNGPKLLDALIKWWLHKSTSKLIKQIADTEDCGDWFHFWKTMLKICILHSWLTAAIKVIRHNDLLFVIDKLVCYLSIANQSAKSYNSFAFCDQYRRQSITFVANLVKMSFLLWISYSLIADSTTSLKTRRFREAME